jgi:D-alanyl-D-alanine carboxypeptidase/D-alanyl-D-alanine-endopeptidase (penicillin-binding protein 4)
VGDSPDPAGSPGPSRAPWVLRWLAEIVVVLLLVAGVAIVQFHLDTRWFGAEDPVNAPAAVPPPAGLALPKEAAVAPVSSPPREVAADPARVAAAIAPLLRRKGILGKHIGVLVTDLATGRALYRAGTPLITPASTTKLLTTTAALETLGPMARFRTTVRWDAAHRQLVLVGGGDPFLASSPKAAAAGYPHKADVVTLARKAVAALRAKGVRRVHLAFDDSYFSGPSVNPAWPATYIPESVVPPISALWVDEGHGPGSEAFVSDPAAEAARVFAAALRQAGLKVAPKVVRTQAAADTADLAAVESAPLGEIVERTLEVSDNQAAEVLARHVGLAEKQQGSFAAGTKAVFDTLTKLGVDMSGDTLYDGSGLSRMDRLKTDTLAAVVRLATSAQHPELRSVLTGLPVAGFTGSLTYRFDKGPQEAKGRVRAKTGTLTGVHALAGVADDASGARMVFVLDADRVRLLKNLDAQTLIDRVAGALGACTCGVGSQP